MSSLVKRFDAHLVACAAAAGAAVVGTAQKSDAAIVWSGPVNLNVPATTAGLYLNVQSGVNNTSPAAVPGWDINPWGSTTLNLFNPTAPAGGVYASTGGIPAPLAAGTPINASTTWGSGTLTPTNLNSTNNLVGFRFQNEANANQTHYGWVRFSVGATAATRSIVEYAWEDVAGVGINAGAVPAPGSLALLALGAAGLAGRRRK